MLQPTVVVLEDVDLAFSNREDNFYSVGLGELLDELDGFAQADQITFILTTNAIDRVERAIRERPGRVSQCIYFGPPAAELRRRYLQALTRPYDVTGLSFDLLVERTKGVSQAFLKELVYRSVQIGTDTDVFDPKIVVLSNAHFEEALEEMRAAGNRSTESIIGFRTSVSSS
jgi:SpoVK/Ycf46/Vps4 family AAA+-type ATPase